MSISFSVKAFSQSLESFRTAIVVGGTNISDQRSELRAGVEIVVATPGRFIDHLQQGNTSLTRISYVVLDEADRMLDMGFEPQIREIDQLLSLLVEEAALAEKLGHQFPLTIVFVERKTRCDEVAEALVAQGLNAVALHGGRTQTEREGALRDFRHGPTNILAQYANMFQDPSFREQLSQFMASEMASKKDNEDDTDEGDEG